MHLSGQQLQVYNYIKAHAPCTIREIRNGTYPAVMKPDMRISEINFAYREKNGTDLIVNVGRNKSREVLKGIKGYITKRVQHIEIRGNVAYESFKEVTI